MCRVLVDTMCFLKAVLLCQHQLTRSISCALLYERGVKGNSDYLSRKVAMGKVGSYTAHKYAQRCSLKYYTSIAYLKEKKFI